MKEINYLLLENLLNINNVPIIIKFWSEWCEVCKVTKNIIEEIKKKFKKNIKVMNINVDYNLQTCEKFYIKNAPTLIIIKNKNIIKRKQGAFTKNYVKKILEKII